MDNDQTREEGQETEFTLGMGKLLAVFFIVVILCGVFFSLGYSVGKNSTPLSTQIGDTGSSPSARPTQGGIKPGASSALPSPTETPTPAIGASPQPSSTPGAENIPNTPPADPAKPANGIPEGTAASPSGFTVQVAALSKQEDADALVSYLRRKSYPVFVTNPSSDKLFHVQVGPFADAKEAEAMRAKLAADGYNAIVKK